METTISRNLGRYIIGQKPWSEITRQHWAAWRPWADSSRIFRMELPQQDAMRGRNMETWMEEEWKFYSVRLPKPSCPASRWQWNERISRRCRVSISDADREGSSRASLSPITNIFLVQKQKEPFPLHIQNYTVCSISPKRLIVYVIWNVYSFSCYHI